MATDKRLQFVLRWDVDVTHSDYCDLPTKRIQSFKGPDFLTIQNHVGASWNLTIHHIPPVCGVQHASLCLMQTTYGYPHVILWYGAIAEVGVMKNDGSLKDFIINRKFLPNYGLPGFELFSSYVFVNDVNSLRQSGLLSNGNLLRFVVKLRIPEKYFHPLDALSRVYVEPTIRYTEHSGEGLYSSRFSQVTGEDEFNDLDGVKFVVTAQVPDVKRSFNCHLHILHLNVPDYIQPLMRSGGEEAKKKAVTWYFHPEVVLETLRFMYSGQCSDSFGQLASEVIELANYLMFWALKGKCEAKMVETVNENLVEKFAEKAHRLSLSGLKNPCVKIMIKKIRTENAVKYLLLAQEYGYQVLHHVAANFIIENFKEIKKRSGCLASLEEQIGKSSLDQILDLLSAERVRAAFD